jgi:hypothetical protein
VWLLLLFLQASEIIHSKRDSLQIRVLIKILEIQYFTLPADSEDDLLDSSDDLGGDGFLGVDPSLGSLCLCSKVFRVTR